MKVIEVNPQGFCKGVAKAIETANQALLENHPRPITILGSLVHNRYVNEDLQARGIRVLESKNKSRLELLDSIDQGTVIFTAHGVSYKVRAKAKEKGLETIDASCPFVLMTQKLIRKEIENGASLLYIGKKGHPEAEGALEDVPGSYLITSEEDIPELTGDIFVTNQTTMSVLEVEDLFEAIRKRYPQARICSEICAATRVRQQAVANLDGQSIDALIVVGDPSSNNTAKLADTGKKAGIPVVLQIQSASEIDWKALEGLSSAAVTSGASTPSYLKDEIVAALKNHSKKQLSDPS